MLKYIPCFAFLALLACRPDSDASTADKPFDSSRYEIGNFSSRVRSFLDSRPEIAGRQLYKAIFLNTEGCSACAHGSFSSIREYFERTGDDVYIYTNDSSLLQFVPGNPAVRFVCVPVAEFVRRDIRHNELYMYTLDASGFRTTHLDLAARDSLVRLR